ncbi:MAG: hypothetical protein JXA77_13395 [Bacteroidales bacterium]|nr:hypothetical protein [Bacteroidales bacterium]MBN2818502.1 hypothetical protein [Bacteroidales bacterium]
MKTNELILNEKIRLSEDSVKQLEKENDLLRNRFGASFEIDEIRNDAIMVSVKNINGQRASKYDLLQHTYKALTNNVPNKYRISIKL